MKHITLGAALFLAGAANAQVFTSGLESWDAGAPTDWVGSKTNIAAADIVEVTDNVHDGTSAVGLTNAITGHKRFTTQNVAVTAGTTYDFSFWVRGTGEIRTGLWDGLSDAGTSYAYNSTYISATAEWTQHTQQVTCPTGATSVQFVLSIRNTVAPDNLVVDDVVISEAVVEPPMAMPIHDIQYTEATDGASPHVGHTVITSGIVTGAKAGYGYFIQEGTGPWNGIFVNDATNTPALGDELEITATVQENFSFTRLNLVTGYQVLSTGSSVPAAESLTPTAAATEQWESVLVTVADMECLSTPNQYGEWNLGNWLGDLLADDELYTSTPTLGAFYTITGPMYYAFNLWRILPRSASDLAVGTGVDEANTGMFSAYPNPASGQLTVALGNTAGQATITLTDAAGRVVLQDMSATDRMVVNTSAYANGVYMLTVRTGHGVHSARIAIQH